MQNCIYNKLLSLLALFAILISVSLGLIGCGKKDDGNENGENQSGSENQDKTNNDEDYRTNVIVPEYKDYGRGTVNFSDISYTRPNYSAVIGKINSVTELIKNNTGDFDSQLKLLKELESDYSTVLSMQSLATVYNAKNTSNQFWNDEFGYVTKNYPAFADAVEEMMVAAANSPNAKLFEDEYFGEGFIEEYKDGGNITDKMVELWEAEEVLEAKYSSLSTASIKVTYNGVSDTVDNLLSYYLDKYGETSGEYVRAYTVIMNGYNKKLVEEAEDIIVSLVKVRREIANELGHASYLTYAYETLGRDYSSSDMEKLFNEISEYAVPVYSSLINLVFSRYFDENRDAKDLSLDDLLNFGYGVIGQIDEGLEDIYAYMLQYGLYDIELAETNRQSGAFTTYIDNYNAPFIFVTAGGNISDYSTLFHEFGHFADFYMNGNSDTSIDQKEISSQGLEYLSLLYMSNALAAGDIQYLKYTEFSNALETLISQAFLGKLEYLMYSIPYENITKESLSECVASAAESFGLNYINDISAIAKVSHLFLYPFYVQSYAVSIIPSLEIYFMEAEEKGSGLQAYKLLMERSEDGLTLVEALESAGLSSPFEKGRVRAIADEIYYSITGTHYYKEIDESNNLSAA